VLLPSYIIYIIIYMPSGGHLSFLVKDTEVSSLSESADNSLNMLGDFPWDRAGGGDGLSSIWSSESLEVWIFGLFEEVCFQMTGPRYLSSFGDHYVAAHWPVKGKNLTRYIHLFLKCLYIFYIIFFIL